MMDSDIAKRLSASLDETKIDLIVPDMEELDKVLTMKSSRLSSLSDAVLTQYIYSLSQYSVYLQAQSNMKNIEFLEAKRAFEYALAVALSKDDTKKTIKEKENIALVSSPEVQKLEKDMRIKSADVKLFEKIPDRVEELINAFKKELSNRQIPGIQYRR